MLKSHSILAAALTGLLVSASSHAGEIAIDNAWIRSAPPSVTVLAGYMTIENHADKDVTLISASSPAFERVELHRTMLHNGMMHMEPVESLAIKAHGSVRFEPNGYHLMLNKPKQKIGKGDAITVTLIFADRRVETQLTVQEDGGSAEENTQRHHHHH